MATSGISNQFYRHGLQIALSIATYIILSGRSVLGASVQRMNLEIMSLLTSNTQGRMTTYIEHSATPRRRQPMLNSRCAVFMKDSTCFDIFPVLWSTSRSPTSSTQCISTCLTTWTSRFSTSWTCMNGWKSKMQSGHPWLLTTTLHWKMSHMRKFLNGMGRRWRKWAGTCLES